MTGAERSSSASEEKASSSSGRAGPKREERRAEPLPDGGCAADTGRAGRTGSAGPEEGAPRRDEPKGKTKQGRDKGKGRRDDDQSRGRRPEKGQGSRESSKGKGKKGKKGSKGKGGKGKNKGGESRQEMEDRLRREIRQDLQQELRQTISEEMRRALQGVSGARPMDDGTSEWSTPREPPSSVGAPRPPEPLGPPPKARGLASPPWERPPPRPLPKPVKKEAPEPKDREKKPPKETAESSKPPEQAAPARGSKVKKEDSPTDTHKNPKKKSRAAPDPPLPPDGDPDWDDDSEYTYTYSDEGQEGPESERQTNYPTVTVTDRSAAGGSRHEGPDRRGERRADRHDRRDDRDRRRPGPELREAPRRPERQPVVPPPPAPPRRRRRDRHDGDPPGDDDGAGSGAPSRDDRSASEVSTARTAEVKEMLAQYSRRDDSRGKPSLSQVRLEPFRGSRSQYQTWKRTLEAQRSLYQLSDPEVAMLVYLSTQGEARAILDQLDIAEMREEGGLQRVMRLLEESFGARSDERFEERQTAFHVFRRTPGMSISEYISTLKRLRNEYLREDPGTVLSDKSFAQRLLSRAGLTKRERMDVFFSAGGRYQTHDIERVLRFRCSQVHVDEKRSDYRSRGDRDEDRRRSNYKKRPRQFPKRSDRSKPYRPTRHTANVAGNEESQEEDFDDDDEEDDPDNEDLEMEALNADEGSYYEEDSGWAEDDRDRGWDEEYYENSEWGEMDDLREAYAAGWKAKSKSAEQRLGRGYRGGKSGSKGSGKGKKGKARPADNRTPDERKRNSRCTLNAQMYAQGKTLPEKHNRARAPTSTPERKSPSAGRAVRMPRSIE